VGRRPGDAVAVYAATEKARAELGWSAKLGVAEMCRDQWAWALRYPQGFETPSAGCRRGAAAAAAGGGDGPVGLKL